MLQVSKDKGLKIIFEDPSIIVIDKDPGLLSIATDKEKERTAFRIVSDQMKLTDPRPGSLWFTVLTGMPREY